MTFDAVFDEVAAVADAVLFEGYLLYPYRASAQKNRVRWQFGVLTPGAEAEGASQRAQASEERTEAGSRPSCTEAEAEGASQRAQASEERTEAGSRPSWTAPTEPSRNRTECLLEPGSASAVRLRLRFLRLQERRPCGPDGSPVDRLVVEGTSHLRFEEGVPVQVDAELALPDLLAGERTVEIALPAQETTEELHRADGTLAGRLVRRSWPIRGRVLVSATDVAGPYLVHRLRIDVVNDGEAAPGAPREEVLRTSLIAAHTVVHAPGATFLSLTDHPRWAEPATKECVNEHTWPVLAGPEDRADLLLSSPIILHDHPMIAPESTINLFDGLENDEILTLRTLTLTDVEKAEARATDPRAAAIVDAVDAMPPEILERLHGAIRSMRPASGAPDEVPTFGTARPFGVDNPPFGSDSPEQAPAASVPWWNPAADASVDPDTDSVLVAGVPVAKGSHVVLRPGRSSDAQDRFLDGMAATVHAVVHDVDGGVHVAVSVDGDPAAEMQLAHGRFRYFRPEELEVAP